MHLLVHASPASPPYPIRMQGATRAARGDTRREFIIARLRGSTARIEQNRASDIRTVSSARKRF